MSVPGNTILEASGIPPLPDAGIRSRVAMIAVSSAGTFDAKPIYSLSDLAEFGSGVMVRHGKHLFATTKVPFLAVRCGATNAGSYATLDASEMSGTALARVEPSIVPTDESELYIKIITGGPLAVAGIEYRRSDSNGREGDAEMPLRALGVATSVDFADINARIEFDPPLAALLAYINELVDEAEDHFAEGATIHGAADAGPYTISGTAANQAAAIVRFNDVLAAAKLHVVKTAGAVHGAADALAQTALNAITTPTTGQTLITAAIAFEAAFFGDGVTLNSGHTRRTASAIHGSVDNTNLIISSADRGTLAAGDIIRCKTNAPTPIGSDIANAIAKLVASQSTPGIVLFPGRTDAGLGPQIKLGLKSLYDYGKPCPAIVQPREPNAETAEVHVNAVEAEWSTAVTSNDILVIDGDYLWSFNDGAKLRQRLTGGATHFAVRAVETEYFRTTWEVTKIKDGAFYDANGVPVGWDENNTPNKPRRVQVFYVAPTGARPFVPAEDYTLADLDNDRTTTFRERRVTHELHRIVKEWGFSRIGKLAEYVLIPNTNTATIKESSRLSLQQSLAAIIKANMGGDPDNRALTDTDAPDLVAINPIAVISGAIIEVEVTVNHTIVGAIGRIATKLSVRSA